MSLVLARNVGESIIIDSGQDAVTVTVASVKGNQVAISIDAPRGVPVDRAEIRRRKETGRTQYGYRR